MKKYEKLTRFIPVFEAEDICRWRLPDEGASGAAPEPEYQEAVYRFLDVLETFNEKTPPADPEAADAITQLLAAFKKEEGSPGVLIGYFENGTILNLLRVLASKK